MLTEVLNSDIRTRGTAERIVNRTVQARAESCTIEISGPAEPLTGKVRAPGCKNLAMPALVAAALCSAGGEIQCVPNITDVRVLLDLMTYLGVDIDQNKDSVRIAPSKLKSHIVEDFFSRRLRGSVYTLALPLLRLGRARIGGVGGDRLAGRSLECHARVLRGFGLSVQEHSNQLCIDGGPPHAGCIAVDDRLAGVSASGLALLLAASIEGRSVLTGMSTEPEITDLACCVRAYGADVEINSSVFKVEGPMSMSGGVYTLPADPTYVGTLGVAVGLVGGNVQIQGVEKSRLRPIVDALGETGMDVSFLRRTVTFSGRATRALVIETGAFPAFPSDVSPQIVALLCTVPGSSVVRENVYSQRFDHVPELHKMGASIEILGNVATIQGKEKLRGAEVNGLGIRETAALVLAGMAAEGATRVVNAQNLFRGYSDLPGDLSGLGAAIQTSWN